MRIDATYRLQLGPDLDFAAAAGLVTYLADLGVSHVYLSPVLTARAGSTHGYDVVDPQRVSETLGGEDGLRALAAAAASAGLGVVVDIVPNHVGTGADNPWWESLLAEGRSGPAAKIFEIDWAPPLPGTAGKVIIPVLGAPYGRVLHGGELHVVDVEGVLRLRYHEHSFPLSAASVEALDRAGGVGALRGELGRPETWQRLHALLEAQHYRLVFWQVGDALINYRRFFAIDDLAGVRVEDEGVFDKVHGKILELVRDDVVDGLRIDHVDGLADPAGYLERLRAAAGDTWIVVEKILGPGEELRSWPVAGTTGYEFLADCVRLFVDPEAEEVLTETARAFDAWPSSTEPGGLRGRGRQAKREILEADLAADLDRLAQRFWAVCQEHLDVRDVDLRSCRRAITGVILELDVYRPYVVTGAETSPEDQRLVGDAVAAARRRLPEATHDFLWDFLTVLLTGEAGDTPLHQETVRRFQQLASATMAKGVEDTLLYRQHRLVALNEVGVEPEPFGADVEAFHTANRRRAERSPQGMLTTATHDTKRGEDVRLRIAAISEVAEGWRTAVGEWLQMNRDAVIDTPRGPAPDPATEYLLYQTMVGTWPLTEDEQLDQTAERIASYAVKATREDGRRTSWIEPDEEFEGALVGFVRRLLDPDRSPRFLSSLARVTDRTTEIAIVAGLSQTLLRVTSPGIPDTYQGLELWGDYLVDPDNRRPADFDSRRQLLADLDAGDADPAHLLEARRDGRVKLWVLSRALRARRGHPACFGPEAGYLPLAVTGRWADHVVAFARVGGGAACITIAPRLPGRIMGERGRPPLGDDWEDTELVLPDELGGRRWSDALAGAGVGGSTAGPAAADDGRALALAPVLANLPVALLTSDQVAAGDHGTQGEG